MQGVLIASASAAVKNSLGAILQKGRTVHHCRTVADCLSLSTAQHFDYIFVDDVFEDGNAQELVRRLSSIGYSIELIPIVMSSDRLHTEQFTQFGVKYCITKPFNVEEVEKVLEDLEELIELRELPLESPDAETKADTKKSSFSGASLSDGAESVPESVDVREVSQRLKRLIGRLSNREDLLRAFADSIREQFDVDNTVILLPGEKTASFTIKVGHNVPFEVVEQFFIPYDDPLMAKVIRLGEPIWVHDKERLGKRNAITAMRYGERLNIQVLCPVLSRGRMLALVGISRFHRYENSPDLINLLRLFITFFGEALENTEMYEKAEEAENRYRTILDAAPYACLSVTPNGQVTYINPSAEAFVGQATEDVMFQRVEKVNTHIADIAWESIETGQSVSARTRYIKQMPVTLSAIPLPDSNSGGALVILEAGDQEGSDTEIREEKAESEIESAGQSNNVWGGISRVIAHNFKNALVPIKTCAELLPERYNSEAFRQSFFSVVQDNITQMDRWIKQLLQYGQMHTSASAEDIIDMHNAVEEALEAVAGKYSDVKIDIQKDYAENDRVNADAAQLEEALEEILKNAFEAVQDVPEPYMKINTQVQENEGVYISILDNGGGFGKIKSSEAREPCVTDKLHGLGMGLACAEKLLKLQGADLNIENADGGARITIKFPDLVNESLEAEQK